MTWTSYPQLKIQSGTTVVGDITNVTITAVDLNKAFVVLSAYIDYGSSITDARMFLVSGRLTSSTNLRLQRKTNLGTLYVSWFVVESV